MSFFPETVEAMLAGRSVALSFMALFDFTTQPMRLWTGSGVIGAGGFEWHGLGDLASISGLEQAINGEAPETTFTLAGINSQIMSIARDEFDGEAKDRLAKVFIQFHNATDDQPLTLYDEPFAIWAGRMQTAQFEMQGPQKRTLSITAESLFSLRSRPNFSQYTDADQKARFAGDRGFEFVNSLINKTVTWPDW